MSLMSITSSDKGYFGIITYFVQVKAVMVMSISLGDTRLIDRIFSQIQAYSELGLNFELTYLSDDTCALKGLTTTTKLIFKLLFLSGIYFAWVVAFALFYLFSKLIPQERDIWNPQKFKIKLIDGFIEILKHTYLGFSSIVFYSLTCTSVAEEQVWFYDGSVQCYNEWQTVMIIFCLSCLVPYPFLETSQEKEDF